MNIRIVNPLNFSDWDNMAARLPGYSFFHTSAWCRVLAESYRYQPVYFTAWQGDELCGVVPMMEVNSMWTGRRGVSLPFSDYCEPLLTNDADFAPLLNIIQEYAHEKGWKFVELRGIGSPLQSEKASKTFLGHRLDLSKGIQVLQKRLRDSTRRNITKAEKSNVSVEIGQSNDDMKAFCRLNCITRQRHGLPPQPLRFFEKFFRYIINAGLGSIVLARFDGNIIAAAVYVHTVGGESVLYKYGASDKEHQSLRGNNLVMWKAIKWYAQEGFDTMFMGRTDIGHDGLRQFKTGWNTQEYAIKYYRYDVRSCAFTNGSAVSGNRFKTKILQYTPLVVLRAMGRVVYRHAG